MKHQILPAETFPVIEIRKPCIIWYLKSDLTWGNRIGRPGKPWYPEFWVSIKKKDVSKLINSLYEHDVDEAYFIECEAKSDLYPDKYLIFLYGIYRKIS